MVVEGLIVGGEGGGGDVCVCVGKGRASIRHASASVKPEQPVRAGSIQQCSFTHTLPPTHTQTEF